MASAKCAREECGKTVYPIEELKCLDKVWHKGCFKCSECGMTLSMKTYKGYEKKPYCQAHYPKTVPTVMSETPEMERVKANTAYQSQVKYHEAYEKGMKGTKIEVADDPETKRLMSNTQNQSLAHYHGELKKKEQQDSHRDANGAPAQPAANAIHQHFDGFPVGAVAVSPSHASPQQQQFLHSHNGSHHSAPPTYQQYQQQKQQVANYSYGQLEDGDSPYSQRMAQQAHGTTVYSSEKGGRVESDEKPVGSIADYNPMAAENQPQQQRKASVGGGATKAAPAGERKASAGTGFTVRAIYDYIAADKDEVSFKEGDVIVNCQKVDDGWLTGTVQRTLLWGMLPANYVEKVNQPSGQFKLK